MWRMYKRLLTKFLMWPRLPMIEVNSFTVGEHTVKLQASVPPQTTTATAMQAANRTKVRSRGLVNDRTGLGGAGMADWPDSAGPLPVRQVNPVPAATRRPTLPSRPAPLSPRVGTPGSNRNDIVIPAGVVPEFPAQRN